jgi:hypothetical protein
VPSTNFYSPIYHLGRRVLEDRTTLEQELRQAMKRDRRMVKVNRDRQEFGLADTPASTGQQVMLTKEEKRRRMEQRMQHSEF